MSAIKRVIRRKAAWTCCLGLVFGLACQSAVASAPSSPVVHDPRHDFDWDIGAWKTVQHRLLHPLTGSTTWVEYHGTDIVHRIWDGANSGIIEADGPAGHLEIYTIRLYDPDTHEWGVSFTNPALGKMSLPVIGGFKDGQGEFYDQEVYDGKTIFVRFSISGISADKCHFEQAFSTDGGKTWETNFIVDETRMEGAGA